MLAVYVPHPGGGAAAPGGHVRLSFHASVRHTVPSAILHEPYAAKHLCHSGARFCSG